jgi:hypothetical protein
LPAEPFSALPPTMGVTAMTGAPRLSSSSRMPLISRIGRMTWYGFDGTDHHRVEVGGVQRIEHLVGDARLVGAGVFRGRAHAARRRAR